MGGDGSGRRGYRPVVEHSFTLDSYSCRGSVVRLRTGVDVFSVHLN